MNNKMQSQLNVTGFFLFKFCFPQVIKLLGVYWAKRDSYYIKFNKNYIKVVSVNHLDLQYKHLKKVT